MKTLAALFETELPVAMVTGSGAARVGNTVARDLAAAGCAVVLHANASVKAAAATASELCQQGHRALVVQGDVGDERDVRQMFDDVDREFGRIDVLVNSAAIWKRKKIEHVTATDVVEHFSANALGSFLCCQQAGLRMCDQPAGGAIVNVVDWSIVRPYVDFAAYFPSKGAVDTMTKSLAVEFAARNPRIRVNAVLPGPVLFPPEMSTVDRQAQIESTLVKQAGTPDHVAHAVRFLVENEFITGVSLPVDGGRSIYAGPGTDQQFAD
jgi:NAD(P)-dependent dehydrogenase (short-subunit alcohol dehydrogenase family)